MSHLRRIPGGWTFLSTKQSRQENLRDSASWNGQLESLVQGHTQAARAGARESNPRLPRRARQAGASESTLRGEAKRCRTSKELLAHPFSREVRMSEFPIPCSWSEATTSGWSRQSLGFLRASRECGMRPDTLIGGRERMGEDSARGRMPLEARGLGGMPNPVTLAEKIDPQTTADFRRYNS